MGIENLHILIEDDAPRRPTTRRAVSRHETDGEGGRFHFVYGWDQPLQSFYFQKHDTTLSEEKDEDPVVVRMGATADTRMYEVDDLVREAKKNGLYIPYEKRVKLYGEKDDGV